MYLSAKSATWCIGARISRCRLKTHDAFLFAIRRCICFVRSPSNGLASDWHFAHLTARAVGGAGIVAWKLVTLRRGGALLNIALVCGTTSSATAWHAYPLALVHKEPCPRSRSPTPDARDLCREDGTWETVCPSAIPFGNRTTAEGHRECFPLESAPFCARGAPVPFPHPGLDGVQPPARWNDARPSPGGTIYTFSVMRRVESRSLTSSPM